MSDGVSLVSTELRSSRTGRGQSSLCCVQLLDVPIIASSSISMPAVAGRVFIGLCPSATTQNSGQHHALSDNAKEFLYFKVSWATTLTFTSLNSSLSHNIFIGSQELGAIFEGHLSAHPRDHLNISLGTQLFFCLSYYSYGRRLSVASDVPCLACESFDSLQNTKYFLSLS